MKKFFSLVLALVMALSLTTVAWADDPTTVEVADSTELVNAINGTATVIKLKDGDYALRFTNNTAFNVDGLTIVGLGDNVNLAISSSEVSYGRIQGNEVVFENINFTDSTVGATGKATYNYCNFEGKLECASSGAAETYAYKCDIGQVHTSLDMNAGAAYFEECEIASAAYNTKATMNFTKCDITDGISIWGGNTVLNDCTIDPEKISCVGSGAGTIVMDGSFVASDAATLITALKAANVTPGGATVTLLDDITISDKWDARYTGAKFTVPVTIDGNGKTLTFTGEVNDGSNHNAVFRFEGEPATVKNLTIDLSNATAPVYLRAISTKVDITVDNCTFIGDPNQKSTAIIFGEGSGAAIGEVNVTVTNSAFTNWRWGVSDNLNGQDAESVSVSDNTFTNADVVLSASDTVTFNDNTVDGGKVTITSYAATNELAVTATGNTLDADEDNEIDAKTITTDTNDFALTGALVAPAGYSVVNGKVVANSSLKGNTITLDVDDLTVTDKLGADVPTTSVTGITKYAASTSTTTVNGKTTTKVVPTWFLLSEGAYNYTFVECDKACADFLFAIKGVGSFYVRAMDVPAAFDSTPVTLYTAPKTATCDKVGQDNDVYVVADGKYYATDSSVVAGAEKYALLSNGKMVVYYGEATAKPHNWAQATKQSFDTKTGVITSVKCPDCKGVVAVYKNAGVFDGKVYKQITVGVAKNYYYVAGTAANTITGTIVGVPTTPSTDKVQSAETFDAGIAMYVGMSVMAAAGSAVVIGKKKD